MMQFLFLLLFGLSAQAYYATPEESCALVDLRGDFQLKMRNQHELGWCFAHAAADYLQFTYKIDDQISAADIAINYSQTKGSRFVTFFRNTFDRSVRNQPAQTGLIKYAVRAILPQGYCPESSLPSDEWTRVSAGGVTSKVEILQATLDLFELQAEVKTGSVTSPDALPWRYDFKNIRSAGAFYDLLKQRTRRNLLLRLRAKACATDRKPFPAPSAPMSFRFKGKRVFQRINSQFDRRAPLTIDFFSDLLKHYDSPAISLNNLHTVLTVGRRFDTDADECSYLIKDSYGEQCSKYDPKIKCEGGYVWLPESKLYRSLLSTYLLGTR
jgi:hypothetical protein